MKSGAYKAMLNPEFPAFENRKPGEFYGESIPGVNPAEIGGKLIVIEGADGSGRSTQVAAITEWLEQKGYPVVKTGLQRSRLVAKDIEEAKQGNILSPRTLSLFYATDFADQLENTIIPALKAGFIVLADRYIYTLMARDLVRGAEAEWLKQIYSIAMVPDIVYFLRLSPSKLIERHLARRESLDYWESGMDIGYSRYWYNSFILYQTAINKVFMKLTEIYGFKVVDGNRPSREITEQIKSGIEPILRNR